MLADLIVTLSMALAAAAILVMFALVVRRLIIDAVDRRRESLRRSLTQQILGYLGDTVALESIRAAAGPRKLPVMRTVLRELSYLVRGNHVALLANLGREIGVVDFLLAELHHARPLRRAAAARDLVLFPEDAVLDALREGLEDPDVDVRLAVAESLTWHDAVDDVANLLDRLGAGRFVNSRVLMKIFRKLAIGRVDQFVALLKSDAPSSVKVLLLDALGESSDFSAIDAILQSASDINVDVRTESLRALAQLGHPGALPAVQRGLADPAWEVRAQAAKCAGRIALPEVIDTLKGLLDDEQWWVRYRSAESLAQLGPRGMDILEETKNHPTRAGRMAYVVMARSLAA